MVTVSRRAGYAGAGGGQGFKIERLTYTLDGDPVDADQVKQNTRLVVVLKVTEAQPQFGRVIVADYLPAGFEIDNPHLVSSGDTGTLSWITDAVEPANTEFRDDRFTAAFNRKRGDPAIFTVAYVVRAVSPGSMCGRRRASRTCTARIVSAAPQRKASKSRRRNDAEGDRVVRKRGGGRARGACSVASLRLSRACCIARCRECRWIVALGPPPLGKDLAFSTEVVDRHGKPAARLRHRRGTLAACPPRSPMSIRVSSMSCSLMKTNAFVRITASIRWRSCAPRSSSSRSGPSVSGGSTLTMQVARLLEPRERSQLAGKTPPDRARRRDRTHAEQRRRSSRSISISRPMAATSKASARRRSPISARSRAG